MKKVTRKPQGDRRSSIAERALVVLAKFGSRGLTHRAVDDEAELPRGSTSYYFRTRDELVAAAAARLLEDDERDVAAAIAGGGLPFLLARWSSRSRRYRLVARFELFLDATRNPKTRALLRRQRATFLEAARAAFEQAGMNEAALRGELLVATMDGLLLGGLVGPKRSSGELRGAVQRMFFET